MQIKGTACQALLSTPLFCFQEVMFHLDFLFAFAIENSILSSRLSNLDHRFSKHRGSRIEFRVETVNICCLSFRNGLPASISDELECQQRRTLRMIIIKRLCRKPKYPHRRRRRFTVTSPQKLSLPTATLHPKPQGNKHRPLKYTNMFT